METRPRREISRKLASGWGWTTVVGLLLPVAMTAPAGAQYKDPKFEYGKVEEAPAVEWKASAKVGFVLATGNAQSGTGSLGGSVSRKASGNKFALDGGWAYARARVLQGTDTNESGAIDAWEIDRKDDTVANAWFAKARYDRFFSTNNSLYVAGLVAGDTPAGKEVSGGGQIGYSRQLYKSPRHEAVVEAGYDFSYEDYVTGGTDISIHSLRLFTGYTLKVTDSAGLFANLEGLFNLSPEGSDEKPLAIAGANVGFADPSVKEAGPFRDTRLIFKTGLSSTFFKKLSVSISFGLKFDNVPAPLPPFKIPYAAGVVPLANKTDTLTEAALIYSFF